jgi:anti-sigma regulatory factor (Ser/Thr protein kinase)
LLELSLHLLDIVRNAVEAGASRVAVTITEDTAADRLTLEVGDDGRGMTPELARRVVDPFTTSRATRHVGLGLPLLAQAARQCAGDLKVESEPGRGTTVRATFQWSHWDRAPLGDVPGALLAVLLSGDQGRTIDLAYTHRVDGREFRFDTAEVRAEIGEVPLTHPGIREWILEALREGEAELQENGMKE